MKSVLGLRLLQKDSLIRVLVYQNGTLKTHDGKTVNRVLGEIKNDGVFTEEESESIDASGTIGSEKLAQAINALVLLIHDDAA